MAKLLVWGCVWESGHRHLARVQGSMDRTHYWNMLKDVLGQNIQDRFLFQQDNAPCHRSNQTREVLEDLGIPDAELKVPNHFDHVCKLIRIKCFPLNMIMFFLR